MFLIIKQLILKKMAFQVKFEYYPGGVYTCTIKSPKIFEDSAEIISISGQHKPRRTNADVKIIIFQTTVNFIPKNLGRFFPNAVALHVQGWELKSIRREDLIGLKNLERLIVDGNFITSLPDDLFEDTPKLKNISFCGNKIESMSSKLLQPVIKNEFLNIRFRQNTKIDAFYKPGDPQSVASVEELVKTIDLHFPKPA